MVTISSIIFVVKNLRGPEIKDKRILEVGSYNSRTNIGTYIDSLRPKSYIGTDINDGPDVNVVCSAESLLEKFNKRSFDTVISIEVLEHVIDWRKVISNIKNLCKPDGIILITTRSYGFEYHLSPRDYWRYEINDMKYIFSDFEILEIEKDRDAPGVFLKAKKPQKFIEKDLSGYKLYNIVANKRMGGVKGRPSLHFYYFFLRAELKRIVLNAGKALFSMI